MPNAAPAMVSMAKQPDMLKHTYSDDDDDDSDDEIHLYDEHRPGYGVHGETTRHAETHIL